jgi:hypothetical protein
MANAHAVRLRVRGSELGEALSAFMNGVAAANHRIVRAARSTWCTLNGGHYKVLHTEPTRLSLKCVACGHTTPGWEVGGARLRPRYPGIPERMRMVKADRPAA